ncbi:hypothetical protein [Halobacteriovorax sp. RT-2-6]|uniref:hypothetical protein n=1 Tax=unclassified Halobacteriovorax TaxID=2639665 RepID=UPI00399BF8DD
MKKLLLGLLIAATTQAGVIHSDLDCRDSSFAYNKMSVLETENSLNISLTGATVFKLFNHWEARALTSFSLDKSKCRFSEDRLLISCRNIENITVTRTNPLFGQPHETDKVEVVNLKNLMFEVRFEERANYSRFVLETQYVIEGSEEVTSNKVSFSGAREVGCEREF